MSSTFQPGSTTERRPRDLGRGGSQQELVARQKEEFGGMKFGCSFFGWLAATGMVVLLTVLRAAAGTALGLPDRFTAASSDAAEMRTAGLVGGITLLVVVLLSYFCGGYVAARMARFNGLKQGLGVWLWALVATAVLVVLGYIAGGSPDLLQGLRDGMPAVPVDAGALSSGGIIVAVSLALVSLVGALLGGLAGMRFHRRVDRAALEDL